MDLLGGLVLGAVWLLFAILSSLLASNLGHSRIVWFVLGLIFGPLSFLALGALPAPKADDPASSDARVDSREADRDDV